MRSATDQLGNFWWSAIGSVLNLGLQADDRWLAEAEAAMELARRQMQSIRGD